MNLKHYDEIKHQDNCANFSRNDLLKQEILHTEIFVRNSHVTLRKSMVMTCPGLLLIYEYKCISVITSDELQYNQHLYIPIETRPGPV